MTRKPLAVQTQSSNLTLAGAAGVAGRMIALICALLLISITATREFDFLAFSQYIGMAAILLVAVFASRNSATLLILGYVFAFLIFVQLRTVADDTALPTSFHYAISLERILFLGSLPSAALQKMFYVPGHVGILDYALSATYLSYFAAPHLAAAIVWRTRKSLFPRVIVAVSLTFLAGLFFYFLIPTAPPWLASESGAVPENIHRVVPELSAELAGNAYEQASATVGTNDVAAMPSLHTALTTMVALIMASYGRRWRYLGIAYVAMMGTALVYLGEHYVIDEIAGVAMSLGIWRLVSTHRLFAWLSPKEDVDEAPIEVRAEKRAA